VRRCLKGDHEGEEKGADQASHIDSSRLDVFDKFNIELREVEGKVIFRAIP